MGIIDIRQCIRENFLNGRNGRGSFIGLCEMWNSLNYSWSKYLSSNVNCRAADEQLNIIWMNAC